MVSRRRLPSPNRQIADAWNDARKREPRLTQGEFARRTFPATTDPKTGERVAWSPRAGSRQLGRILRGEDSDVAQRLVDESYETRIANIEFTDDLGRPVGYANVLLPPGTSSFDAWKLQNSKQARRLASQLARGRLAGSAPYNVDRKQMRSARKVGAVRPVKVNPDPRYVGSISAMDPDPTESLRTRSTRRRIEESIERAVDPATDAFVDFLLGG